MPTYKKNQEITNIKQLNKYSVLQKLIKPRSPLCIQFMREPGEDWFIELVIFKKATGEIRSHSLITNPDMEEFVERYQRISKYQKSNG